MATFNMTVDGYHHSAWGVSFGDSLPSAITTDDDNSSYVWETSDGDDIYFTFAAPPVASAQIASITSLQVFIKAAYTHASNTNALDVKFSTSGNDADTITVSGGSSYALYNGLAKILQDPPPIGSAWAYSDLESLQVQFEKNGAADIRKQIRVSYLYVTVTYVPTGYTNDVMGVDSGDISTINGIATANISKVNGV